MNPSLSKIKDFDVKRKLKLIKNIGTSILPKDELTAFIELKTEMIRTYSTAKVVDYRNKSSSLSMEPDLTLVMARSETVPAST